MRGQTPFSRLLCMLFAGLLLTVGGCASPRASESVVTTAYLNNAAADCIFQRDGLHDALWSPTSEFIAVAAVDPVPDGSENCCTGQVWLVDATTDEASAVAAYTVGFETIPGEVLAWLPNGTGLIVKRTVDGRGAIYDMDDGSLTEFAEPILGVSPDGQSVLHLSGAVGQ